MSDTMYPLQFKPVYKDYIWGGDKIIKKYDRDEPDGVYAESWEVTERDDGMSVVENGPLAGKSLREVIAMQGRDLLGARVQGSEFPLLIKLIDSRQCLSVQVHPDDESAAEYGGEAKTEMWYVLDADEGARVLAGLKEGVDRDTFVKAIEDNSFGDILNPVPVDAGDAIYIHGGRVHAIDKGCLLLEVQQNSNTTYRIYDWGRVGNDGKPRELHIEQALQVIDWNDRADPKVTQEKIEATEAGERWEVLTSPYFRLERWAVNKPWDTEGDPETFQIFFAIKGEAAFVWENGVEKLTTGRTCMVPAALGAFEIRPIDEPAELLRVTIPA